MTRRRNFTAQVDNAIQERDGDICQVCGLKTDYFARRLRLIGKYWHRGHKVDFVCGGDESEENLCVMCVTCNMWKPLHKTLSEYERWVNNGYWLSDMKKSVKNVPPGITDNRLKLAAHFSRLHQTYSVDEAFCIGLVSDCLDKRIEGVDEFFVS